VLEEIDIGEDSMTKRQYRKCQAGCEAKCDSTAQGCYTRCTSKGGCSGAMYTGPSDPTGGLLQAMGGRNPRNVNFNEMMQQLGFQGKRNPRTTTRQRRSMRYRG
jgi:hypothetical protein